MMMIDSHIHLSHRKYDLQFPYLTLEPDGVVSRQYGMRETLIRSYREAGIMACVKPAIDLGSNEQVLSLAHTYPGFIFPAIGVHPTRTCLQKSPEQVIIRTPPEQILLETDRPFHPKSNQCLPKERKTARNSSLLLTALAP